MMEALPILVYSHCGKIVYILFMSGVLKAIVDNAILVFWIRRSFANAGT